MSGRTSRLLVLGALVAVGGAVFFLTQGGGDSGHHVSAVVGQAANLVPGQEINAGGQPIGSVKSLEPVDEGRAARIEMEIDDEDYWPLPVDSSLEIRWGGTVSFSNRHLLLTRGKATEYIEEDGEILTENVKVPVEVDEVLSIFEPPVRDDISAIIDASAGVLERGGGDLNEALVKAPPVVENLSKLLRDFVTDRQRLHELLASTGAVVDAVDRASPDLRVLLDGAARTFDAMADEADDLQLTLQRFPSALRQTRTTLAHADVTLRDAGVMLDRLAPGIEELRLTAGPLTDVLATLRDVTPTAVATLERGGDLDALGDALDTAIRVGPAIRSTGKQATRELACVRPYAPEIVMLGTTWGDWMSVHDDRDHLLRATVQNYLPASYNNVTMTAGEAAEVYSGLEYGFPRPPGTLADQPWFQPKCGAGPGALDPNQDQEGETFRANQFPLPPPAVPTAGGNP